MSIQSSARCLEEETNSRRRRLKKGTEQLYKHFYFSNSFEYRGKLFFIERRLTTA